MAYTPLVTGIMITQRELANRYRLLAQAFSYPDMHFAGALRILAGELRINAWDQEIQQAFGLSMTLLLREMANLVSSGIEQLQAEYTRLFNTADSPCPLCEHCYRPETDAETLINTIQNIYAAWKLATPRSAVDRIDVELEFLALLCCQSAQEGVADDACRARQVFLQEHSLVWMPIFSDLVTKNTRHNFYREAGHMLTNLLDIESEFFSAPVV